MMHTQTLASPEERDGIEPASAYLNGWWETHPDAEDTEPVN